MKTPARSGPPLPLRLLVAVLVVAGLGLAIWRLWPRAATPTLGGYIEGDLLYLSTPVAGALGRIDVERGQRVGAGVTAFVVDPRSAEAEVAQARAAQAATEAQALDAEQGSRPAELAVIAAQRAEARARLRAAQADYDRVRTLVQRGVYAPARLDGARAEFEAVRAQTEEVERRLDVAELPQRQDQIRAARARAVQAAAQTAATAIRLGQLAPVIPVAGRIQEVFYQVGEWAPANQPVVALLPDSRVKVRFYAPERQAALYRPGVRVRFTCDGCGGVRSAVVTYVSSQPEFTPPVIYSRDSRDKLVFLIEARPERPADLNPGLPVDVFALEPDGVRP